MLYDTIYGSEASTAAISFVRTILFIVLFIISGFELLIKTINFTHMFKATIK